MLLTLCCSALVGATDESGKSIFAGKPVTGFSNVEEEQINKVKASINQPVFCTFADVLLDIGCTVPVGRQDLQPWGQIRESS
jgi:hypothetical protein